MACEGCNLSMSLVTYACDDLAYLCISDLIREGICPVSRPHFPKVVGLWGTLPTKIYAQLRSCTHPPLYDTYTSKYDLWMGTHGHILYMHTDWLIISPVCQDVCQFWAWFEVLLVELQYVFPRTACQPHSLSTADACSPVSNPPLLLLVFASLFHLPPLFIHTGMCDMWISRQGVWYSCWAPERRPNTEEVVKNNPAATSTHASFITSLSPIQQPITHLTYL